LVGRLVVSDPSETRVIAEAKVTTDKVDARILAQLLQRISCRRSGCPMIGPQPTPAADAASASGAAADPDQESGPRDPGARSRSDAADV